MLNVSKVYKPSATSIQRTPIIAEELKKIASD
jgi:hypothetical protein